MDNTEQIRRELAALSADYFTSNPDVDTLLVVVGTKVFYRPERESLAAHEAAVAETSVLTIHRREAGLATPELVDVEGANIETEFPASVGIVEMILASVEMVGETPRKMAEIIWLTLLNLAGNRPDAETQMEAVEEYMMGLMADGLSSVTYTPEKNQYAALVPELATVMPSPLDELLVGALHIPGILADAPAAATTETAPEPAAPKAPKAPKAAKPAAAPKAVKAAKPAKAVKEKKATTPKASK